MTLRNARVGWEMLAMWVLTAAVVGLNIFAATEGKLFLIGVSVGVTGAYAIAGIFFGIFAAWASNNGDR